MEEYDEYGFRNEYMQYTVYGDKKDTRSEAIRDLKRKLKIWENAANEDEALRKEHPGLADLYERYQTMLELVK